MIDWHRRLLVIPDDIAKEGGGTIGLGVRLFCLLKKYRKDTGFILPRFSLGHVSKAIKAHFESCGITDFSLHGTRHTYCTLLQDVGLMPKQVMQRTRHKSLAMVSNYTHEAGVDEIFEDRFEFMKAEKT